MVNPTIALVIPLTVPVNVGLARLAFKSKAVCCAVETGLAVSAVLSTLDNTPPNVPVNVGEDIVGLVNIVALLSLITFPNPTSLALAAVNISDCKVEADLLSTLFNPIVVFKVEGLSLATLFNPNVAVVILELSNTTSALLAFCITTAVPPSLTSNLPAAFTANVKLLESALPAIVLEVGTFAAKSVAKSVILDCAKVGILAAANEPLVILAADKSGNIASVTAAINSVKLNFFTAPESLLSRKIKLSFAMSILDKAVKPLIISVVPMLVFVSVFIAEISRV